MQTSSYLHELIDLATETKDLAQYLPPALAVLSRQFNWRSTVVMEATAGTWQPKGPIGNGASSVPSQLLSDALDHESGVVSDGWFAIALDPKSELNQVLAGKGSQAKPELLQAAETVRALLAPLIEIVRVREQRQRRLERLEAILEIAAQWNQTLKMDELLCTMAQTSTRLLGAERASIFLWDRDNRTLVGRPALGVEGDELRVPDHVGVVGQVIQSGQSRRVGPSGGQDEINRDVDRKLGFQTTSLLCVPLRGRSGELFGAFELINKIQGTFSADDEEALTELAGHASIALENTQQHEQLVRVRDQMTDDAARGANLIGECPPIEALRSTILRVAKSDLAVIILGENGTGKEVVARRIHYLSRRSHEPFIAVNCAALTETLLESELFGHEKGAFTDASDTRIGKFELASGGTLFLDEIGDMSLSGQAKLLRVLEEKLVVRVGGSTSIHTDARVIAATNHDLAEMVRGKQFREDLFYRLNVVTLELPSLRERGDDISILADHFLGNFSSKAGRKPPTLTAAATKRLLAHVWPGNVRELRNLMERLVYLSPSSKIDVDELTFILSPHADDDAMFSSDLALADATKRFQAGFIQKHVDRARGNMTQAADRLGLHRSNLYRKMRQLGMETNEEWDTSEG